MYPPRRRRVRAGGLLALPILGAALFAAGASAPIALGLVASGGTLLMATPPTCGLCAGV